MAGLKRAKASKAHNVVSPAESLEFRIGGQFEPNMPPNFRLKQLKALFLLYDVNAAWSSCFICTIEPAMGICSSRSIRVSSLRGSKSMRVSTAKFLLDIKLIKWL